MSAYSGPKAAVPVALALSIGLGAYLLQIRLRAAIIDPLVLALLAGILVRSLFAGRSPFFASSFAACRLFIPFGIVFYAAENLNFIKLGQLSPGMLLLLIAVILAYFGGVFLLGRLLGQRLKITCLVATGSAICGASAIAITSPAVEAEPDDVSVSLLAVTLAALLGLFIVVPFLATLLGVTGTAFGLLAGSIMQFTGFVKEAVQRMPYLAGDSGLELARFAVAIKAGRYLGLLIAIPLVASVVRRRVYLPWSLWAFLLAGILGTWLYQYDAAFYQQSIAPFSRPAYQISWGAAMAAVGLNADVRQLLSDNGVKAFWMALGGMGTALATFFFGLALLDL